MTVSVNKYRYPGPLEAAVLAMNFPHEELEIQAVKDLLASPKEDRTPLKLERFGTAFAMAMFGKRVHINYVPGGPNRYWHRSGLLELGRPEIIILLHELGHAKLGHSEVQAVAYSTGLLMKADPTFIPLFAPDSHVLMNDPY